MVKKIEILVFLRYNISKQKEKGQKMRKQIAILSSVILTATLFLTGCATTSQPKVEAAKGETEYRNLSADEAKYHYDNNKGIFIDARPANLYMAGTIMGAKNVPSDSQWLQENAGILPADTDALMIAFCNGPECHYAEELAGKLENMGYTNVILYLGGYPEWRDLEYPRMGLLRECEASDEEYEPANDPVVKNGVEIYPGGMPGMVDQFWLAPMIATDTVPADIVFVDVRSAEQFEKGHLPGAINVHYSDDSMDESKIPSDKLAILYCNTGMTSTEAFNSLSADAKERALYFDANIKCEGTSCEVEPNEDLSSLF